jgi:NIPSNAP
LPVESLVELRQYTLHPGRRDTLIELFDGSLVEPQEAAGMAIIGQFRDLEDPDRFVWLRGFPSPAARAASLRAFYGGPVWRRHAAAANATMIDSDNVLLLRPVRGSLSASPSPGVWLFDVYLGQAPLDALPVDGQACFATAYVPNTFPALPVREGEHAFVSCTRFDSRASLEAHLPRLDALSVPGLVGRQRLILAPTAGSRLR